MHHRMSPRLVDLVRADIAVHEIGDGDWLRVSIGGPPPSGTWTTRAALLADDARGLAVLVDAVRHRRPEVDDETVWSGMHHAVAWPLFHLTASLLARTGRLLRVEPDDARIGLDLVGDDPGVRHLAIRTARVAVVPDDPWLTERHEGGVDGVEVVDTVDDQFRLLARDAERFLAPLVDAVRSRVPIGRRGLWGMALDALLWPFADERPGDGATSQRERVERVLSAAAGTSLAQPVSWIEFDHGGRRRMRIRTTSCCLAYRWPAREGAEPRRDGCDLRWNRYCSNCPLIPDDEAIHRARFWIDHRDLAH